MKNKFINTLTSIYNDVAIEEHISRKTKLYFTTILCNDECQDALEYAKLLYDKLGDLNRYNIEFPSICDDSKTSTKQVVDAISECDIMVAYTSECCEPSFEMGVAYGCKKPIILLYNDATLPTKIKETKFNAYINAMYPIEQLVKILLGDEYGI